jgi:PadR family transcriptional regulator, regulatory protein PadR
MVSRRRCGGHQSVWRMEMMLVRAAILTLLSQRKTAFVRSIYPLALLQEVSYLHVEVKGEALLNENIDLPQGTLDLLILRILAVGRQHGWAISERVQQMSSDVLRIQQGSLYPALHRLERRGLIKARWGTSENNRRAKYYELSKSGHRQLEVEKNAWAKLTAAVAQVLGAA